MAGSQQERQENAFVSAVNRAVKKNGVAVKVKAGTVIVSNVVKAEKYEGRQAGGSEPYIDINLVLKNGKTVGISMKGPTAPSLAGGGMSGINLIIPGLADKFMKKVHAHLMKTIDAGDKVPDCYGKIANVHKEKIVVGNARIGGPIDYMYIGSMEPNTRYDQNKNILEFSNGKFHEAKQYARSHQLYFRLRARRIDQVFDPDAKDRNNVPKIYSKSPSKGDSAGRIVVVDTVPANVGRNVVNVN